MKEIIKIAKETIIEMVQKGADINDVAKQVAQKFGKESARLIMIDVALDLGLNSEAKKYLASFK